MLDRDPQLKGAMEDFDVSARLLLIGFRQEMEQLRLELRKLFLEHLAGKHTSEAFHSRVLGAYFYYANSPFSQLSYPAFLELYGEVWTTITSYDDQIGPEESFLYSYGYK